MNRQATSRAQVRTMNCPKIDAKRPPIFCVRPGRLLAIRAMGRMSPGWKVVAILGTMAGLLVGHG